MTRISIPVNLDDVKESKPVPGGKYRLIIASAEETKSQKGFPQIKVSIGIDGQTDAPNLTHFISLPSPGDEKAQVKGLFLRRFLELFAIPFDGGEFDLDDFIGAVADAELTLSEPDDNGNVYNRLQLPRIQEEGHVTGARRAPPPPKS